MSNIWHNTIGFYTSDNHDDPIYHEHIKPNNQHCIYQTGNYIRFNKTDLRLWLIVCVTHIIDQNHIHITVREHGK